MAAIVYNGLQTCLESQLREPRILRLKLSSFTSSPSTALKSPSMELGFNMDLITNEKSTTCSGCYSLGGFSSLHALSYASGSSSTAEPSKKEVTSIYVPPLQVKPSSMVLSEKSLQLCTEDLGSESGTDMTENCIVSLEPKSGDGEVERRDQQVKPAARLVKAKKTIEMQRFPPPLTTIRGSESLRVRPCREEGRLVMEAVKVPSNATRSFLAERSHGRLRLCFLESTTPTAILDSKEDETESEENEGTDMEDVIKEKENDIIGQRQEVDEEEEDGKGREYFGEGECREELIGNKLKCEDDVGIEIYEMPRTCKKGDHESNGLLSWEAILVASS